MPNDDTPDTDTPGADTPDGDSPRSDSPDAEAEAAAAAARTASTSAETTSPPHAHDTGAPPRVLLIVAAVLALALATGVGVLGLLSEDDTGAGSAAEPGPPGPPGPLPLVSIPAPQSGSDECRRLITAAPDELESAGERLGTRTLADPAPQATKAWGHTSPVVLRCGLERPPELTPTSTLRQINGVQWLQVPGTGSATWYVVDRPVYAALTVPDGSGTGPLQGISDTVADTLDPVPPRFG